MFSLNRALFFLFSLFSLVTEASVTLPAALYTIDDLVSEFRSPLKTKMEDLKKNYRARTSNNLVVYSSHEPVNCLFTEWPADAILTKLEYYFRKQGPEALDVFRYSGCGESLTLVERFLTVGGNREQMSFNRFSVVDLKFELKKEWKRYFYQLQNNKGENLLTLSARWLDSSKTSKIYTFSIRDQEFLVVKETHSNGEARISYTFKGYDVKYEYLPWYKRALRQDINTFTFNVVKKAELNTTQFISSRGTLLSQNTFLQFFTFWAIKNGLSNVKSFVDFHLYWFPPTELVNTGGQSQRLINELRLNLNRILNSTNLNLVEVYLRNLIQAVENGLIQDRRPAE